MDLRFLHQKRVAVVLRQNEQNRVLFCTGSYRRQPNAPRELALHLDASPEAGGSATAIVLREDEWNGAIHNDAQYGCRYRIDLELPV